jgi:hypothetical protein
MSSPHFLGRHDAVDAALRQLCPPSHLQENLCSTAKVGQKAEVICVAAVGKAGPTSLLLICGEQGACIKTRIIL